MGSRWIRACALVAVVGVAVAHTGCSQHYEEGAHPPPKTPPRQSLPPGHPPLESAGDAQPAAAPEELPEGAVTGTVRVAAELEGRVPPNAVLFLMVRERPDGGPPYAVKRLPVPRFPFEFVMSQDDVIPMFGEGLQFADIPEMYLTALIDTDGRVGDPQPGDLEGTLEQPIAAGDRGVDVVIDTSY